MGKIIVPDASEFPRQADVVIIGGGILGTVTAFYASRAGLGTVVLEMRDGLATLTTRPQRNVSGPSSVSQRMWP